MNYEDFSDITDTEFQVAGTEKDVKLRFFEISEKKETPQNVYFSLLFKSRPEFFLEQGNYNLRHEKLGEGSLFLVPIRQDEDGFVYEAVFNRHAAG